MTVDELIEALTYIKEAYPEAGDHDVAIAVTGTDNNFISKMVQVNAPSVIVDGMHNPCLLVTTTPMPEIWGPVAGVKISEDVKPESNFEHVIGNTFKVHNQNGFNNALYYALGCAENDGLALHYTKKELREAVQDWPNKYPALVEFDDRMLACHRVYVTISYDK
ncbi:hypothetical protein ABZX01_003804 [Vibrio vulnificus]